LNQQPCDRKTNVLPLH